MNREEQRIADAIERDRRLAAARIAKKRPSLGDYRTDKLFNVRINGVLVAADITREAAQPYLNNRKPREFLQVYLAERPLEGRRGTSGNAPPIPRMPSLRVSEKEREKLRAALPADGTMSEDAT
jgi:hypothetical protein